MRMLLTFYMILNRVFARREKIGAPAVTRQKVLLAILAAAQGRTYTPVQIQKAVFLITRNLPGVVTEGPSFEFSPYDYGPFDASVYQEAEALSKSGLAVISPSGTGRWNVYSATDTGNDSGTEILRKMKTTHREYIENISKWVRSQGFGSLVKSIYEAYPEMKANSIFQV